MYTEEKGWGNRRISSYLSQSYIVQVLYKLNILLQVFYSHGVGLIKY